MRKLAFVCLMLVAMLYAPLLRAQEVDAEGCKDSPLISRFPGGTIHSCETFTLAINRLEVSSTVALVPSVNGVDITGRGTGIVDPRPRATIKTALADRGAV